MAWQVPTGNPSRLPMCGCIGGGVGRGAGQEGLWGGDVLAGLARQRVLRLSDVTMPGHLSHCFLMLLSLDCLPLYASVPVCAGVCVYVCASVFVCSCSSVCVCPVPVSGVCHKIFLILQRGVQRVRANPFACLPSPLSLSLSALTPLLSVYAASSGPALLVM